MATKTYLTTDELASLIKYDPGTIRERMKDSVLLEGAHYIRPFGCRKILYIWEKIEADMGSITAQTFAIQMSQLVFDALKEQEKSTRPISEFVFCNREGQPLDYRNVNNRVWKPLLRHLGLKVRRPYQCRHTAATLWLGAGENPEWIARQLGHTTTEMLFRVYSRYVPNLTRRDGSAFERLLTSTLGGGERQIDIPATNTQQEVQHG